MGKRVEKLFSYAFSCLVLRTAELSQINADKRLPQCGVRIQSPFRPYDIKNPAVQGLPLYLRIFLIVLCSYFA